MISVPMEARVVHLQLLVALTAQRLCALNLQTARGGAREEQGRSPWDAQPWSPTFPWLVTLPFRQPVGLTPHPFCSRPASERVPRPSPGPSPPPQQDPSADLRRRGHGR